MKVRFTPRLKLLPAISALALMATLFPVVADDEETAPVDVLKLKADDFQGTMGERVDLTGNVELLHGRIKVNADSISVIWEEEAIDLVEAEGNPVRLEQYDEDQQLKFLAQAETIKFRMVNQYMELRGNAELIQQGNKVTGELIRYDIEKEKLIAESGGDSEDQVEIIWQDPEGDDESE